MSSWKRGDFDRAFPIGKPALPDSAIRLYLFLGPDESSSRELAGRVAKAFADPADPMAISDIASTDLAADPGRLPDEAASVSMFGGSKVIRVAPATDSLAEAARLLLAAPAAGNPVIFVAGDLGKASPLRKLAEESPAVRMLVSYPLAAGDARRWLADAAKAHGIRLEPGVGDQLLAAADGDTGVLAQELEKFALFLDASAADPKTLSAADFSRLGADSAEDDMNALVHAITMGKLPAVERQLALLAGSSPIPALRAMARRLLLLADLRAQVDAGVSASEAVNRVRPPIFFKEKDSLAASLSGWSRRRIAAGLAAMLAAEEGIKTADSAGSPLGWQALLLLAVPPAAAPRRRAS